MNQKIFITGGSGLLALNWAVSMRDRVDVILNMNNRDINLRGSVVKRINLNSIGSIVNFLESDKPNYVIHAAGMTNVEECEKNPDLAHKINVGLTDNVARACKDMKIPLIHISSDHLFDGKSSLADEEKLLSPLNVYGKTKAQAEEKVLSINSNNLVVRTNFYGWGTKYRISLSDFIFNALRNNQKIVLFKDIFFTPILIDVLANRTMELIDKGAQGIFHITGDDRISKYDFGLLLAKEFGLNTDLIEEGLIGEKKELVSRPKDMSLSNLKISEFLGKKIGSLSTHLQLLHKQKNLGIDKEINIL